MQCSMMLMQSGKSSVHLPALEYFNLRVTSELLTKGRHDSQTVTDELAAICIELQNTAVLLISLFRIIELPHVAVVALKF